MLLSEVSPQELVASPMAGYVQGDGWLYFAVTEELIGYALYGEVHISGVEGLVHLMEAFAQALETEPHRAKHAVVAHLGSVRGVDPTAFNRLANFIERRRSILERYVRAAAIVRPTEGLLAAIVEGFFPVVGAPFPIALQVDFESAFLSVGSNQVEAARELDSLLARTIHGAQWLFELRDYIRANIAAPSITKAAAAVGMSSRSLQRRLRTLDTSFTAEVQNVRLDRARQLLRDEKRTISEIAYEVGFSSPQHLSRVFGAHAGSTPSAYRSLHRPKEPS